MPAIGGAASFCESGIEDSQAESQLQSLQKFASRGRRKSSLHTYLGSFPVCCWRNCHFPSISRPFLSLPLFL